MGDYHSQKTGHLNPKLAKLMGLSGNNSVLPGDDCEDMDDDDEFSVMDDDEYSTTEEDLNEQERALLSGMGTPPIADEMKNAATTEPMTVSLKKSENAKAKKRESKRLA